MALDLSEDEILTLIRLLTRAIEDDRIRTLKAVLAKLDPTPRRHNPSRFRSHPHRKGRARQETARAGDR